MWRASISNRLAGISARVIDKKTYTCIIKVIPDNLIP